LIQSLYNEEWCKAWKKPIRIFYEAKCYRYERPQAGRYREFTQFGVELLGADPELDKQETIEVMMRCVDEIGLKNFERKDSVKRGLSYYVEDGFEIECPSLGAQKQVAGGGRYKEGIGFAFGIDRLMLALDMQEEERANA